MNKDSLRKLQNDLKWNNSPIVKIPEGDEKEQDIENLL